MVIHVNQEPRIVGWGYSTPANKRGNDDPIFDWIKTNNPHGTDLFKGYVWRRVLSDDENLITLMLPASIMALQKAGVRASDVDLLIGYASVSSYETPNDLGRLHQQLGLPSTAWVLPMNQEFSNFNASIAVATSLIRAGLAHCALVAIGSNWTRYVDYHTPQSVSVSDGAAAVVITRSADTACFSVVDTASITDSTYYGTMALHADSVRPCPASDGYPLLFTPPTFHITHAGFEAFAAFGMKTAPEAALNLMQRHGLVGENVTLISHQASQLLLDAWQTAIQPAQYVQTLKLYANMTLANIPVNFAWSFDNDPIQHDSVVCLAVGAEQHSNAVLLRRG